MLSSRYLHTCLLLLDFLVTRVLICLNCYHALFRIMLIGIVKPAPPPATTKVTLATGAIYSIIHVDICTAFSLYI